MASAFSCPPAPSSAAKRPKSPSCAELIDPAAQLTCRGSKCPSPCATKTICSLPESSTAFAGTTIPSPRAMSMSTFAYIPGFRRAAGLANEYRTLLVRDCSSTIRVDVDHASQILRVRIRVKRHAGRLSHLDERDLRFVDLRFHPHHRRICHLVERLAGHDMHAGHRLFFDDEAGRRRMKHHRGERLACAFERGDVLGGQIPQRQPLTSGAHQRVRPLAGVRDLRLLELIARFQRQQKLVLRAQQLRAVDREQRLAFANRLPV